MKQLRVSVSDKMKCQLLAGHWEWIATYPMLITFLVVFQTIRGSGHPDTQTSKYRSFQYRGAHRRFSTFLMVNSCGEENLRPRTHIIWNLINARTGTQAEVCQTCSQKASYDLHTYLLKPPRWTPPPPAWTPQWWTPPTSAWTVPPTKRILLFSRPLHSSLEPTPPVR